MSFGCGHPETPENTDTRPNGWRECRTCKRAANKTWKREHRRPITLRQRIFDRASIGGFDACWHWLGKPNAHGYGELRIGGKSRIAHRAVYEYLRGPIPEGRVLHHTCEVRTCVNPRHLIPLTIGEHQAAHRALTTLSQALEPGEGM